MKKIISNFKDKELNKAEPETDRGINPHERLHLRNYHEAGKILQTASRIHSRCEDKKLVYTNDQETISSDVLSTKSIRLDVYVEDDAGTIYDIEVQTTNKYNLGKRTRFYQSLIDVRALKKRHNYKKLRKSFIIFICNYDQFNENRLIYTFRNRSDQNYNLVLDGGATKIIINTNGTLGEVSLELEAVIQYLKSGIVSNEYTKSLDEEVAAVKADEKVRRDYMLLMEAYANERSIGEHKRVVAQIRKSPNRLLPQEMADYFDVTGQDCVSILDCIREHPEWDNGQIAEEVYWEDDD